MRNWSEIEQIAIQYFSIGLSLLVFGSMAENILKPIELTVSSAYQKTKTSYRDLSDFLYKTYRGLSL